MTRRIDDMSTAEERANAKTLEQICDYVGISRQYANKIIKRRGYRPIKIVRNTNYYNTECVEYVKRVAKPRKPPQNAAQLTDVLQRLAVLETASETHVLPDRFQILEENFQIFQAQTKADIKQIRDVIKLLHDRIKKFE